MKMSRAAVSGIAALSLVSLSGCVTDPNTGEQKVSRTALGTGGGALAGLGIRRFGIRSERRPGP